jgi:hypothetical protein
MYFRQSNEKEIDEEEAVKSVLLGQCMICLTKRGANIHACQWF